MEMTIELDCAPGGVRPNELVGKVVAGTVLEQHTQADNPRSTFFGNWTWDYTGKISEEEWRKAQELTAPRVRRLYNEGFIRYGSW